VNLNLGTTYYVRAYATNSAGTGYGSTVSFTTAFNDILFNPNKTYGSVTDVEGNVYKTISIGTQTWTAENLRTTKYRNGDLIGTTNPITLDISTLSDKRFQWAYDGDESLVPTYGRLYTWFTVTDSRGVCPNGWHVATNGEWTLLINYLGGESVAGGKLKETSIRHWADPNTGATNESGFTALPGGYRDYWGAYYLMGFYGEWWSSTEYNTSNAWYEYFNNDYSKIVREYRVLKHYGGSVRCVSGELTQPTLSTNSISSITSTSAVSGGNITSDGGSSVTASGICWSTSPTPIITSNKSTDGSSAGSFTSSLTGLSPNTTYYVRAYATNGLGTVYGSQVSFTTNSTAVIPIVSTTSISFITGTTASSGGAISNDGGSAVTARGVCWSTAQNPAITDSKTADGSGTGNFTSSLSGLSLGTTYYARAYATNSAGTAYGNSITFTTSSTQIQLPTISTIAVTSSSWDSGASGGIITSDGGATVTVRGVCWSNSPSPTISGNKTTDGSGTGSFSSSFNGLLKWWRYYVRAYATNIVGTAYGNEISFTTMIPPLQFSTSKTYGSLTDADGNVYKTIQIGSQTWMAENLRATKYSDGTSIPEGEAFNNEWSSLVSPGYSWLYWNDETFKSVYGALYNWYTVNTSKLCPTGWHVPNDTEWKTLTNLLGGESIAGVKLKEMGTNHWDTPNTGATNETGFTAIPGGNIYSNGSGMNIGSLGGWWSSTLSNTTNAWSRLLYNTDGIVHSLSYDKRYGFSVRCLKD
jgi:uncharacterized protein (TIGR02145 family)